MTFAITAAIAEDPRFRARIRAALLAAATDIHNETPSTSDTTDGGQVVDAAFNAAARSALALDTLAAPAAAVEPFAWVCAANWQVQSGAIVTDAGVLSIDEGAGAADDAALSYLVAANWDRVARWRAAHPS